ncbi:MAG: ribbon-helix-helix protein, CopG family [Mycobacterium sp.]|nr:ribbon-helix-helix protein, CopG family [Mycobacterium sp.]
MTRTQFDPSELGPIGSDIDLDEEDIYTPSGERLTEDLVDEIAIEALAKHPRYQGRPSLTGAKTRTPAISVRVPPKTRATLERIAKQRKVPLSRVAREALTDYAERHDSRRTKRPGLRNKMSRRE